ncbi:hypothetical protein M408DRAFT_332517 [Serendipita vermifera MAFF 305830]|uniref:Uncharacterized protein n=1 Tax=Serendipita vermifera MAFF 305830 TaxID=933852 RepID=A0A0C3AEU7_SERVB|nr:hypothetical protein M408DRAFT_332517 [Serendipita vermifera MAFF 305830]
MSCENQAFIIIYQLERLESPKVGTTARNARVLGRERDHRNALSYFENSSTILIDGTSTKREEIFLEETRL